MGVTANAIIRAAYADVGVTIPGEPLSAADAQDALERLNKLCSSLRTQTGVVVTTERQAFRLMANQQTYTIGIGGDFNVPRPVNPAAITGAGLWMQALAAAVTLTSLTRSGNVATGTKTTHGFVVGDEVVIAGATQLAYNGIQTVATVPTVSTFTFAVEDTPVTPATGTITASKVTGEPVEIPRMVITDDGYQNIRIKNLPNSLFTNVYYTPTFPLGTISLWPKPNVAVNQLILYLQNVFTGFADLSTSYDWPNLPGYEIMLEYQLAVLLIPFGRPEMAPFVMQQAAYHLGLIKRANNTLTDIPNDYSRGPGSYNINSDTQG